MIKLTIIPGEITDQTNLTNYDFTWSIDKVDFNSNQIHFQLQFFEPLYISSG
jgi:hypothetical protein